MNIFFLVVSIFFVSQTCYPHTTPDTRFSKPIKKLYEKLYDKLHKKLYRELYRKLSHELNGPKHSSLVNRSRNAVKRSRNFIQEPNKSLAAHTTRIPSSILNAPTGLTSVTTLTMETDLHIANTIEFIGDTAINGNGNILYLDAGGSLQIDSLSTLVIKNVTIKGVGGQNIFCVDNTGKIMVQNVTWVQDSDFTFDHGSLDVLNNFHCIGNGMSFIYRTTQGCTVHSGALMTLDYKFTFNYSPTNLANNLLTFVDQTATMYLSNGSLSAGPGGLAIQSGLLFFEGESSLITTGAPGITIGDGNSDNDTICIFGSAAILDLSDGSLTYNNVLLSSWNMRDINATLKIFPNTTFNLLQSLDLGAGTLMLSSSATFNRPDGVSVTGNVSFF